MKTGLRDLGLLLAGMTPVLGEEVLVYCLVEPGGTLPEGAKLFARIEEAEGTTLVLAQAEAERLGLSPRFSCRRITLEIHSALEAVGLTAALAAALTEAEIPANVIAGYFHDHILVPLDRAEAAMTALKQLQASHAKKGRAS